MTNNNLGKVTRRTLLQIGVVAALWGTASAFPAIAADNVPTLWLIGDSTMRNGTKGQQGWGDPVAQYFDPSKIRVVNRGRGGRSSRTFLNEKLWDAVLSELKPGDYVVIQFGHNDGGPMDSGRARASIHDNGDDVKEVTIQETGVKEVVHSYGWYLRRYIADTKAKGATPIVLSPVSRNAWGADGTVNRASGDYGKWAAEAAKQGGAIFINFNEIIARRYEALGKEKVAPLFTDADRTHTNPAGAEINAASFVAGIKSLSNTTLVAGLSIKAAEVEPAPMVFVTLATDTTKKEANPK
ncbi:MAG: rhamnogalacturonan acetylesterase [Fibrella sp.]|nr:rhamnogalacturonan acetylesterase [Armatimonadota bacterium]